MINALKSTLESLKKLLSLDLPMNNTFINCTSVEKATLFKGTYDINTHFKDIICTRIWKGFVIIQKMKILNVLFSPCKGHFGTFWDMGIKTTVSVRRFQK